MELKRDLKAVDVAFFLLKFEDFSTKSPRTFSKIKFSNEFLLRSAEERNNKKT